MASNCLREANTPKGVQTVCSDRSVAISLLSLLLQNICGKAWDGASSKEERGVSAAVNGKQWKFYPTHPGIYTYCVLPAGLYKGCGVGSSYPLGRKILSLMLSLGIFSSVQSLSHVQLFVTQWTAAHQASLSITTSQSLLQLISIELVMPSNHLILCHPLLLLPSTFPSIRVFSNESVLYIRWPKYWSFSFNNSPSKEYSGLIYFRLDWLDLLQCKGLSRVFSNTTVQRHQFFSAQLSL